MKSIPFFVVLALTSLLFSQPTFAQSLGDVASPDELAEELGLDTTRFLDVMSAQNIVNVEEFQDVNGFNVLDYYHLVVVINKSADGPEAQTMRVYQDGKFLHHWLVSTGRERQEDETKSGRKYFSATPVGYFSPQKLVRKYWSITWEAWMEYAIFFNGGVAMHATTKDHFAALGTRNSGGCVRLHPKNAKILWGLQEQAGTGLVPVISRTGRVARLSDGSVKMAQGYSTLVIVQENR